MNSENVKSVLKGKKKNDVGIVS